MLALLDASAVRRWCHASAEALAAHRGEIDDLNVYPIPDGDTGTNLELTLRSAAEAVAGDRSAAAGTVLRAMAQGAVMGARGNSGVIVSQVLCGLADAFDGVVEGDGGALVTGLRRASDAAYAAVSEPVEGTVLSVIRASAEAVEELLAADAGCALSQVVTEAVQAAETALRRTPEQLEVLARAGVVDAGGRGLVVLLAELAAVVTGEQPREATNRPVARNRTALQSARESGSAEYGYEVQYLLHTTDEAVAQLKPTLAELGDSLVVVGTGTGLFNVHVHVNDVGAAIEAGVEAGRPHRITVIRFEDQVATEAAPTSRTGMALVAVAPGEGLADLFRSEGVAVVDGGPTDNPSVAEVLNEILGTQAAEVILLPNASAVGAVAELAAAQAREQGVVVAVVPTKSPLQGLAAVAVHDEGRRFQDNVIALAEAAAATRFAEVTVAVRESITYAGRCEAGDVLGLIDGEVVEIGSDVAAMGISLVSRLVAAGGELVTVLSGTDAGAGEAATAVQAYVRREHPLVEINGFVGGQPHYPLLIGVE
ncbi:MAG: DAK2 domain-containing protein [Actinomycetota bacterium]|nr:DAK2 domain-containing protein [Actinomycetota bacterium]MDQ2956594.1 DAK2 domain-containing protein [Actinomycetota bacterium]